MDRTYIFVTHRGTYVVESSSVEQAMDTLKSDWYEDIFDKDFEMRIADGVSRTL